MTRLNALGDDSSRMLARGGRGDTLPFLGKGLTHARSEVGVGRKIRQRAT